MGWMFPVMEKLTKPLFPEKNPGQKVLIMSAILLQGKLTHWEREISIPGKSGQLAFSSGKNTHIFPVLLILHTVKEKLTSLLFPQDDEQQEEIQEVRLNLPWEFSVLEKLTNPLFPEKNPAQKVLIISGILLQGKFTDWERKISVLNLWKKWAACIFLKKKTHFCHVCCLFCMQ